MSAITKTQMKTLMKEVKDGRILKKVLNDVEKGCLFCYNQSFKSTITLYNLEKKHNIKSGRSDYAEQISRLLNDRNILLGRKEKKEKKRVSSMYYRAGTDYGCLGGYEYRKKMKRDEWNKRKEEMARYEAMGALWCDTPLCEDMIGEIMSYL